MIAIIYKNILFEYQCWLVRLESSKEMNQKFVAYSPRSSKLNRFQMKFQARILRKIGARILII